MERGQASCHLKGTTTSAKLSGIAESTSVLLWYLLRPSRVGNPSRVFAAKEAHKPPVFLEKLQNTGVADGYPVRLECRVSGVPPPQIFWKKENESLTHSTDRVR